MCFVASHQIGGRLRSDGVLSRQVGVLHPVGTAESSYPTGCDKPPKKAHMILRFLRHHDRPPADHDRAVTWAAIQHGDFTCHHAVDLCRLCRRLTTGDQPTSRRGEIFPPSSPLGVSPSPLRLRPNPRGRQAHPRAAPVAGNAASTSRTTGTTPNPLLSNSCVPHPAGGTAQQPRSIPLAASATLLAAPELGESASAALSPCGPRPGAKAAAAAAKFPAWERPRAAVLGPAGRNINDVRPKVRRRSREFSDTVI